MPQNDLTAEDRARELGARERYSAGMKVAIERELKQGPKKEARRG